MKRHVSLLLLFVLSLVAVPARATTIYVAQSAGTFSGGTACNGQTTISVSTFNSTKLSAGTTYELCGTITTALTPQNGGSSGSPVLIQWDSGASVSVCNTTGAVQPANGLSYLVMDLGGNSTAITCPNNGTGLSTDVNAVGINPDQGSFSNVEIRNGTIGPLCMRANGDTSNTSCGGSLGIYLYGGGNNYFHNLTFNAMEQAINYQIGGTVSGDQISYLTIVNTSDGIWYACGGSPCTSTGVLIHDNNFTPTQNWANPADNFHGELLHFYSNGSGTSISGAQVYNNSCVGSWPNGGTWDATACIFAEAATSGGGTTSGVIFNNLCQWTTPFTPPGDGCIYIGNPPGQSWQIYNNTIDCGSSSMNQTIGMELDGGSGMSFTYRNNIIQNCEAAIENGGSGGTYAGDTNIYYNIGDVGFEWHGNSVSFATWQSDSGTDANSSTSNPGLNSNYTIASSSSLAHTLGGDNLTSLDYTALDTGAPQTNGASGACGTGCVARASSGTWDLGVYPLAAGAAPSPPTNLTATPH